MRQFASFGYTLRVDLVWIGFWRSDWCTRCFIVSWQFALVTTLLVGECCLAIGLCLFGFSIRDRLVD